MNDFTAIADTIKHAVSITYSKHNTSVSVEEAKERSKRGALVFDTIDQIFQEHANAESSSEAPLHLMCVDEDMRYTDCRNSNKSTRRMAEYLSMVKDSGFTVLDKSSMLQVLNKREQSLAEYGYEARNAKTELVRMMDNLEQAMTQVQSQVEKYMKCTHKQLEMQNSILKKEAELGDKSIPAIQGKFNKLLSNANELSKPGSVKSIADMYSILQQKEKVTKQDIASLNGQMIQHSLETFNEHIQKRHQQIEEINQLLPVLAKVIAGITGEEMPTEKTPGSKEKPGSGMVKYFSKVRNIFG
jgi:hypothetical protein